MERYDVPWIDTELDPGFKQEIENFPGKNLPDIYTLIEKYREQGNKTVIIFKSREQADAFLQHEIYNGHAMTGSVHSLIKRRTEKE